MIMGPKERYWHAIYVKFRSEKKVAVEYEAENINYYLPLIKVLKTWSDRKKWIEEPLFRSYIFVYVNASEYYKALNVPNALKYISFENKAVVIPNQQIEAIKFFLEETNPPTPEVNLLQKGMKVEIIQGSMTGLRGELVEVSGKKRVIIQIDVVAKSITLQIPASKLRIIE